MYLWTPTTLSPPVGEPSALLQHLAGAFAPRVAGFWRAPHAAFLTAPAERRHLACLALALAGAGPLAAPTEGLLELSLRSALARFVPDAPPGLARALGRLGEVAWAAEDYRRLLALLAFGASMKVLRHAESIPVERVRALAALPPELLEAGFGRRALTTDQNLLIADAFRLVSRNQGADAARAAAERWVKIDDPVALFAALQADVVPEVAAPPFPATGRLRPLHTKAAMTDAATRYVNCLSGRIGAAAAGDAAYYEWVGEPSAIVELWRDNLYGWRLGEARIAGNAPVPAEARSAITAELRALGVHVGLPSWRFEDALASAARPGFVRPDELAFVGELYGD